VGARTSAVSRITGGRALSSHRREPRTAHAGPDAWATSARGPRCYPRTVTRTAAVGTAVAGATVLIAAIAVVAVFVLRGSPASGPPPSSNVVLAVRDLSRLESASYHMEKVIELSDKQSALFGLVAAKDAILLVAEGDVVAGVDLSKVTDADVRVDAETGGVRVRLPAPEVFSSTLDEEKTHVYERTTDTLATRNEQLEGRARQEAEKQMRQGAIDAGIFTHARSSAERTVRGLLRALGFARVDVEWAS
jgi:hypothetical protein